MPKGKPGTPGPFWLDEGSSTVYRKRPDLPSGAQLHEQCIFAETMTDAQREELVDLFNKGTHFEGMLAELRAARIIVDKWCHTQGNARALWDVHVAPLDAKIAKAEGAENEATSETVGSAAPAHQPGTADGSDENAAAPDAAGEGTPAADGTAGRQAGDAAGAVEDGPTPQAAGWEYFYPAGRDWSKGFMIRVVREDGSKGAHIADVPVPLNENPRSVGLDIARDRARMLVHRVNTWREMYEALKSIYRGYHLSLDTGNVQLIRDAIAKAEGKGA